MRRAGHALTALALLASCKTDDAKPTRTAPPRSEPSAPPRPAPAAAAAASDAAVAPTFSLAQLQQLAPRFEGGRELVALRMAPSGQARQTWCMPGADAAAIARAMAAELTAAGWTDARSRGSAERAGASATIDSVHVTISVGGRDASCSGMLAIASYSGEDVVLPPVEPGERIH